MSTFVSQITGVSVFSQPFAQVQTKKKTSKLRVIGLCEGNPPVSCGFPTQKVGNTENISIWWRQHGYYSLCGMSFTDTLQNM